MFLVRRPASDAIDRFLHESQDLPLSYDPPGIVRTESARQGVVDARVAVGRGPPDFERARAALLAWRQFESGFARRRGREPRWRGSVIRSCARFRRASAAIQRRR